CTTTAACPTTTLSSEDRGGSQKSSTSATGTSKARHCILRPACSGRTSTARRAATRSTSSAGANYGWPVITYGVNYGIGTKIGEGTAKPGMEQPIHYWVPSIAPSGMAFYT